MNQTDLLNVMYAATRIVASRVLTMLSLAMVFGLFCWAMYLGNQISLWTAGVFAVLVFLPILVADKRNGGPTNVPE
jgi:hypothetical protein